MHAEVCTRRVCETRDESACTGVKWRGPLFGRLLRLAINVSPCPNFLPPLQSLLPRTMAPGVPPTLATHFAYTRQPRDRKWLLVYAAFWAVCLAGAVYGALNRWAWGAGACRCATCLPGRHSLQLHAVIMGPPPTQGL